MEYLSKRETQIMEALYRLGEGTVSEVLDAIPNPPSYSSVRAQLRILEEKGHLSHREEGTKFIYQPVAERQAAAKSMLTRVVDAFFDGSRSAAVLSLMSEKDMNLSPAQIDELEALIAKARAEGR
ncbi:MAG: BlaI/MecI/CopY family transcriptional regulator [Armatimonadetes bacterium]|nr:BlaI/MecI/CopY family transcriptional regulator [Armatimonadota bacterium]